jgi:hypothetical protein
MTENTSHDDEGSQLGISDDQLPEDLRPSEDNPLAGGLDDAETAGDVGPGGLLEEGKKPDQWDDEQLED